LKRLMRDKIILREETARIRALLHQLELINARKAMTHRLLESMLEAQKAYFSSGERQDLAVFPQKELAAKLSVHPSTVCRALYGRSLVTPWGEEKLLDFFTPTKKTICLGFLRELMEVHGDSFNDNQFSQMIAQKYNHRVSRRSVAYYRKDLRR